MKEININEIKEENNKNENDFKDKGESFDRLCKIQKLIKRESALKDLCKLNK